ncbi:uncharacterized protein LOC117292543 isoform X1 [Asterias rubens]|uniref:uncharacterized protein LOC117292543 isoform X1 n=1 Tax=Asterias rubens TaxID=7604 RepID=UPI0014550DD5|nr:uncharacterized protein LOC117292543 isoform X1 [Asterias rubens]
MKEGFVQAMQELSHIQDGDRILQQKVNSNKEETDEKIEKLAESLHQIRTDLSSVLGEVKKNNKVTEKLSKQMENVRKEQSHMRKKIRQNEQNQENHRKAHQEETITPANKSDEDKDNNNNNNKTKEVMSAKKVARRQSMPSVYTNMKDVRDGGRAAKQSRHHTKMAPMIQPFMDSLPDSCDPLNNDGSMNEPSEEVPGRQFDSLPSRNASGSSMSSDKDQINKEHMTKGFNSGRRVSFSNLKQTQDSNQLYEAQRIHLAQELLTSERKYVGQLNSLRENIMLPLVTESLIHPSEINVIFPPSLAKMFDRHCCLLCALETRLGDSKWQGMHGDVVAKFAGMESANFLSQYGLYIEMFPESVSLLSHHTRKSAKLTRFLKKQLADIEDEQADLLGYLLAPIQRIPAYVLHLKTVLEFTETDHPDYFHVESCLTYFGNFLASMNPAIEQAVEAARTYKLFLSERRSSRASSYSPHMLTTSQSSSLTKDSGMYSNDEMSAYNNYNHSMGPDGDPAELRRGSAGNFLSTWNGSPVRLRNPQKHVLSNGHKQDRRASFPMNAKGILSQRANVWKSPHVSKSYHGRTGRRGSHDHGMLSEGYQGTSVSAAIPGMTFIPEQASDDTDFSHGKRRNSRSQSNLPELPTYGIYGEDDTDVEVRYEPSSPTSALPRTRQKAVNQVSQGRKTYFGSSMSSGSSSRTSTPRGDHHFNEHDIVYDDNNEAHQRRKHHRRQSLNEQNLQKLNDLKSDERASSTMHLPETTRSETRKRANSISHINRVHTPETGKPEKLKVVWNEDNQVNRSMEGTSSPRSNLKPTIKQSPRERSEAGGKSNKKSNFSASLKNIFFGKGPNFNWKRNSHVVNLTEEANEKTEKSKTSSQSSPTYCDEDGQPCSDV